jgi:hypothetical protein
MTPSSPNLRWVELKSEGADPLASSSILAKVGRNHLNAEIAHLLPTGIGRRYSQNQI